MSISHAGTPTPELLPGDSVLFSVNDILVSVFPRAHNLDHKKRRQERKIEYRPLHDTRSHERGEMPEIYYTDELQELIIPGRLAVG